MSVVTIQLLVELPTIPTGLPWTETFAITHDGQAVATDRNIPTDVEPLVYAAIVASESGADLVGPPLGLRFGKRDSGAWWAYRIERGGGSGGGRRSRKWATAPVIRAVAA